MTETRVRGGSVRRPVLCALAGLALAGTGLAAQPAEAAARCGAHDEIVAQLAERYGERSAGIGVTNGGLLLELLVGPEGSWTLLVTPPQGESCLAAAGRDWQQRSIDQDGENSEESGT